MTRDILLDPLVPWAVIYVACGLVALFIVLAIWRRLPGWWLRGLAAAALLAAIANPSLQSEEREPLTDIVIAVVDQSASNRIDDRPEQVQAALAELREDTQARANTELRVVQMGDGEGDAGSLLMTALSEAMAEEPQGRIAGIVLITDGRIHDIDRAPALPAPLHVMLTGHEGDWDRRLIVRNAPAFAILDEPVNLTVRIEDQGNVPGDEFVPLTISIDGGPAMQFDVPLGEDMELPVSLPHGGMNVLQFQTPVVDGEITDRNNGAVVQINGVRDRLRVLLVSGEPHAGERTWRNLLKSDSAVDLVHFTILRPPEKNDGVSVEELSLIAFPTRELFIEKIEEFDLIVFDRYRNRGILPSDYMANIATYVQNGGAVLVSSGPEFATVDSLFNTPLGFVIPAVPTRRVLEEGFTPMLTDIGARHPVTAELDPAALERDPEEEFVPSWGRWLRQVEVTATPDATVVMEGIDGRPLLILDRVGEGRVAMIASDQSWLWDRGFEGGGPQLELLRRLAHWMMKEPELEEETLWVEPNGQTMRIIRRTLEDDVGPVTITQPDGSEVVVELQEVTPGRFELLWEAPEIGFYRLTDDVLESVIALGPSAPREFEQTIASADLLAPLAAVHQGGVVMVEDGLPSLRDVRLGRPAAGRGWIGISPREAYLTADVTVTPLLPAWGFLLLASLFVVGAWLREGRR